ncbi:MAG: ABC transporter substrate-binding protein [Candidatus Devosia phytovorans]|uniref:ABC transporter substrate-binding protein n=1 Tax=Candidatus Devosia phytovorans TaxID=3121372 RepID=A0AAJ6B1E4_9HYPH|nr:ABC transporter substrate-binding protein [Devosia sp.]WEK06710.1 MAG: ABC transporter substrate-binding protein [Devosia sp.]
MLAVLAVSAPAFAQADLDALYEAAKAEGQLTVIALPHSWCNYGGVIEGFKAKYPDIAINELNPDAGSADELEAVRANQGNTGPQAPDVLDIGLAFGPQAKDEGLLQPYKVSTWDEIPADAKDEEGYWYGDYYGVLAFGINKDIITGDNPATWADLNKDEFANSVALAGDPRTANNAIMSVFAAGLSTTTDEAAAAAAGLEFFKALNDKGNFVPVDAEAAAIAQGTTPIAINWDYNLLAARDNLNGNPPIEVVVPSDGVVAGVYVQAISAYAPHPNAAKLWMEYLYSDEGQLGWLAGYCHPIRFSAMAEAGTLPDDLMAKLPAAENYAKAVFPSIEEQNANKATITGGWDSTVGASVQ